MRPRPLLLALALLAAAAGAQPAEPPGPFTHRAWTMDEGLPQNSVYGLAQTDDGYLWVGTLQGLARFDGHRFTVFDPATTPGYDGLRVVALATTPDGALWVATTAAGVSRYRDGHFRTFTVADGLASNTTVVGAFDVDAEGTLWVVTDRGLCRYRPEAGADGRFEVVAAASEVGMAATTAGLAAPDGTLWVGTPGGLARRRPGDAWRLYTRADGLATENVSLLRRTRDGTLWVGTHEGFFRFDAEADRLVRYGGGYVRAVLEDRAGRVWVSTVVDGLQRVEGGRLVPQAVPGDPIGRSASALFEDTAGRLWVGTNGEGLHRLQRALFASYGSAPLGAPGPAGGTVLEDAAGAVWYADDERGLVRVARRPDDTEALWSPPADPLALDRRVWSLGETLGPDGASTLWFSTPAGLVRRARGRFEAVAVPGQRTTAPFTSMLRDADGGLLLGGQFSQIVKRHPDGRFEELVGPDDVGRGGPIQTMLRAADGALWFGTETAGVGRLAGREVRMLGPEDGLERNVRDLSERPGGALWASTYGGGLCALSRAGIGRCLTTAQGLPDNTVHAILDDGLGHVWLSSNAGLFRLREADLDAYFRGDAEAVRPDHFTRADGLPSTEANGNFQPSGWVRRDGRLLVPTMNGVAVIDPARIAAAAGADPPLMRVEAVEADEAALGARPGLRVPAGTSRIAIRYTGIHLGNADALRFRYRLDGYDPDGVWIDGDADRTAVYTNLPPGAYTFVAEGALGSGGWQRVEAPFVLSPLWHQTWAFRTLLALGLVGLVAGVGWDVSRRRYRRELAELKARQARDAERARISRDVHDEVGASLSEIAILSEVARRQLDGEANEERLRRIAETSREMLDSLGQIVWAVNPRNDRLPALAGYLREHAARYLDAHGLRARLDVARLGDAPVAAEVRRAVFLVLKESLHNVVKHAGATEVAVAFGAAGGRLLLTVRDDGRGLAGGDGARWAGGDGLGNMARRAEEVGGALAVRDAPGGGVEVRLQVPAGGATSPVDVTRRAPQRA